MRPKIKFIIVFLLIPIVFAIVSFLIGLYFKILPAIAILLLGNVVYGIVILKYGNKIVTVYLINQ